MLNENYDDLSSPSVLNTFGLEVNSISCESYVLSKDNRNRHATVYMCCNIGINKVLPSVQYLIKASRFTTEPYGN